MASASQVAARAGRLLARPGGHFTYEPAPLPPAGLTLSGEIHRRLSEADRALGFLCGQVASRPRVAALVGLACQREAVASCRLEGSPVTLRDLLWWDFDGSRAEGLTCSRGDIRICANYAQTLREMPQHDGGDATPVLGKSLRQLHSQLFRGVRGRDERPGRFRQSEIWLGPRGSTPYTAHHVPPAPEHIPEHLARLLAFAVEDVALPQLARIALITYQLETIHPFVDGSGRVTRLALLGLLREIHQEGVQLLCPSVLLATDLGRHFHRLQRVRREGDWESWVLHFGTLLRDSARAGSALLVEEAGVLDNHEEQILRQEPTVRDTAIPLLRHLASHPIISVPQVAQVCGRSFANANLLVGRLEALGILTEITGRRRHRRYIYEPFVALLQAEQ